MTSYEIRLVAEGADYCVDAALRLGGDAAPIVQHPVDGPDGNASEPGDLLYCDPFCFHIYGVRTQC